MKRLKIAALVTITIALVAFLGFKLHNYLLIRSISPAVNQAFLSDTSNSEDEGWFQTIQKTAKGKTIIGFGEATHGSAELRTEFCKLAKKLIENNTINVVAFAERDFNAMTGLNGFIRQGDIQVAGQILLPYATEMEQELMIWIQNFNQGKPEAEKVRVVGLDVFDIRAAAANILTFLSSDTIRMSPDQVKILQEIASLPFYYNIYKERYPKETLFDIAKAREADSPLFHQVLKNFQLSVEFTYSKKQQVRDDGMLSNLLWVRAQGPARVLVFGHNSHLEKVVGNTLSSDVNRFGHQVAVRFPDEYLTIGSDLAEGTYMAGAYNKVFKIPTYFNKIGNILARCLTEQRGYLFWNETDTLSRFFNRDRYITYGVVDTDAPTYPLHKHSADAFDILYWSEISTPAEVSGNNSFNFLLPVSKNVNTDLIKADSLSVSLTTTFNRLPGDLGNPTFSVGIAQYSEGKNLTYDFVEMENSDQPNNLHLAIKSNCDSLNVLIYGESIDDVVLNNLVINDVPFPFGKMLYSSQSYNSNNDKDGVFALSLSTDNVSPTKLNVPESN